MVFINGQWYMMKSSSTKYFSKIIIGQWGIHRHDKMGGGRVSLEGKCNKVQQKEIYLYL